jgi:hypothetical protein
MYDLLSTRIHVHHSLRRSWCNHLDPVIKKAAWTEEEDAIIVRTHAQKGNAWSLMSELLPGRCWHVADLVLSHVCSHPYSDRATRSRITGTRSCSAWRRARSPCARRAAPTSTGSRASTPPRASARRARAAARRRAWWHDAPPANARTRQPRRPSRSARALCVDVCPLTACAERVAGEEAAIRRPVDAVSARTSRRVCQRRRRR